MNTPIQKPSHTHTKRLNDVQLEGHWPFLALEPLALMELQKDPYYSLIPENQITSYIEKSIEFGNKLANKYKKDFKLADLINQLIKQGIQIQFKNPPSDHEWIRAQYSPKPPVIKIYRSSIQQIQHFFQQMKQEAYEPDCWCIHLYHEWFHHLEETSCGHTYQHLPKIKTKWWGPFTTQKSIRHTREIAAHAFTQTMMDLQWSPLLLDYLILYRKEGKTITQIREHFHQMKRQWELLNNDTPPLDSTENPSV